MKKRTHNQRGRISAKPCLTLLGLALSAVLICSAQPSSADDFWEPTSGPYGGMVHVLISAADGDLYAGTIGGGVLRSADQGENWQMTGLTHATVTALAADEDLYAGTSDGLILHSIDDGAQWQQVVKFDFLEIKSLAVAQGGIFAGLANKGVWRSIDGNWEPTNLTDIPVHSLVTSPGGILYAGTVDGQLLHSTDQGGAWTLLGQFSAPVDVIITDDDNTFLVGTSTSGVFRSTDGGQNWDPIGLAIDETSGFLNSLVSVANVGLFAGASGGIYHLPDGEQTWDYIYSGLANDFLFPSLTAAYSMAVSADGTVFAGTNDGVLRSVDQGTTWEPANAGLSGTLVHALAGHPNGHLFAGTHGGGIFRSQENGAGWTQLNLPNEHINALLVDETNGHIFAGTNGGGVIRSLDGGGNWASADNGLEDAASLFVWSLAINADGHLFAGTDAGVFRSQDKGVNWQPANTGLPTMGIPSLAIDADGTVFAGTWSAGVFRSTDHGESWEPFKVGLTAGPVYTLAFGAASDIFAGTWSDGIFRSPTDMADWIPVNTGLPETPGSGNTVFDIVSAENGDIFAGHLSGGVFRSQDSGASWQPIDTGLTNGDIRALTIAANGHLFAGSHGNGVFGSLEAVQSAKVADLTFEADLEIQGAPFASGQQTITIQVPYANKGTLATHYTHKVEVFGPDGDLVYTTGELSGNVLPAGISIGVFLTFDLSLEAAGIYTVKATADPQNAVVESDETNNELTATFAVQAVPDLAWIAPLQVVDEAGESSPFAPEQSLIISGKVTNQGSAVAAGFDVGVEVVGPPANTSYFSTVSLAGLSLAPGGEYSFETSFELSPEAFEGLYTVTVTADPQDVIAESDETNNGFTTTFDLSPVIGRMVFSSTRDDASLELYVMDVIEGKGKNVKRLTYTPGTPDFMAAWSPDGSKIAFSDFSDIYVMNTDGSNVIQLTDHPAKDRAPTWSADGTQIAFQTDRDGDDEIYAVDAELGEQGGLLINLSNAPNANDVQPAWSADGSQIAFMSTQDGTNIYVMDAAGTNKKKLTSVGNNQSPAWSPDGTKIAFWSGGNIWTMNAVDGSDKVQLTQGPEFKGDPSWSPDGSRIAYRRGQDGKGEIYMMNAADGSDPVNLTKHIADDGFPAWAPVLLADLAWIEPLQIVDEAGDPPPFEPGQTLTFSGTFANQGSAVAADFDVVAEVTGPPDNTAYFGPLPILAGIALAPGETKSFEHSFQLPPQTPAGSYALTVVLDPDGIVEEKDAIPFELPGAGKLAASSRGARNNNVQTATFSMVADAGQLPAEKLVGDFNGDKRVDFADFFLFADEFGGANPLYDVDGSGLVDYADYT